MKRDTCARCDKFPSQKEPLAGLFVPKSQKFKSGWLTPAPGFRKEWLSTMEFQSMAGKGKKGSGSTATKRSARPSVRQPEWSDGLRKLYDSVVEEPLPDSFEDLLKKLDQASGH